MLMRALFKEERKFRMPYYCTVPQCTSMSGKIENVSFHRFPRDKRFADLWNEILKRGKPYTKYSKVCSLHFKQEDFISSNSNKEKRVWKTLKKEAVPSMNLPYIPSIPNHSINMLSNEISLEMHQQMAHKSFLHKMFVMHQAADSRVTQNHDEIEISQKSDDSLSLNDTTWFQSEENSEDEFDTKEEPINLKMKTNEFIPQKRKEISTAPLNKTYSCSDCLKYYKDYDVFLLHKLRTHKNNEQKENVSNGDVIKSNPILANQLASAQDKNMFSLLNSDEKV